MCSGQLSEPATSSHITSIHRFVALHFICGHVAPYAVAVSCPCCAHLPHIWHGRQQVISALLGFVTGWDGRWSPSRRLHREKRTGELPLGLDKAMWGYVKWRKNSMSRRALPAMW